MRDVPPALDSKAHPNKTTRPDAVVGIISDTHGLLRGPALAALGGVDLILHAGDVGCPEILPQLETIAPVRAVRGNVDRDAWAGALPLTDTIEVAGFLLHMLHIEQELDLDPRIAGIDAVIFGHSHRPGLRWHERVLYMNPGSAGPRRFRLPVTVGRILIRDGVIAPSIIDISL